MKLIPKALAALALGPVLVLIAIQPAAASETVLAGTPQLYTVRGDVDLGRPTRYVTFKTATGVSARSLVVTVSGSSGRTYNADDGRSDRSAPRSRTCFRSSMNPFQRSPEPRRLKPGVAYKVRFYSRDSLNGKRTLFATRTLRARSYFPTASSTGATSPPSPCNA